MLKPVWGIWHLKTPPPTKGYHTIDNSFYKWGIKGQSWCQKPAGLPSSPVEFTKKIFWLNSQDRTAPYQRQENCDITTTQTSDVHPCWPGQNRRLLNIFFYWSQYQVLLSPSEVIFRPSGNSPSSQFFRHTRISSWLLLSLFYLMQVWNCFFTPVRNDFFHGSVWKCFNVRPTFRFLAL